MCNSLTKSLSNMVKYVGDRHILSLSEWYRCDSNCYKGRFKSWEGRDDQECSSDFYINSQNGWFLLLKEGHREKPMVE